MPAMSYHPHHKKGPRFRTTASNANRRYRLSANVTRRQRLVIDELSTAFQLPNTEIFRMALAALMQQIDDKSMASRLRDIFLEDDDATASRNLRRALNPDGMRNQETKLDLAWEELTGAEQLSRIESGEYDSNGKLTAPPSGGDKINIGSIPKSELDKALGLEPVEDSNNNNSK